METPYCINKTSGTSADTLLAIGFASVLGQLSLAQHNAQDSIILKDSGSSYTVTSPWPIDVEKLSDERLNHLLIVLPLDSSRQREKQAKKGEQQPILGFDYDKEMENSRAYREQLRKLGPGLQTPEARLKKAPELAELSPPDTRLGHYQTISSMKIAGSFNEIAWRWDGLTPEQKRLHLDLLLNLFSNPLNDIPLAIGKWQKLAKEHNLKGSAMVSALQIINPTTGKGANRAKAGELKASIGNQDSFWLLELLKFRGFMEGAAPLVVQDNDDRKTYVIQPKEIQITLLQDMMKQFRAVFWPTTAVKLDILASLRFAQVLVEHYKELYREDPLRLPWMPEKIVSLAPGFDVTFYKFLGSAHATMNISTIGLPNWLPKLENIEQVEAAEALLDEHVQLIRQLRNSQDKEGAEEYELLRLYRDFLSGNDLSPFWEFTTAYSSYLMSALEKERFIRPLTTQGLETLLMNHERDGATLTNILKNDGFKHIANAIRQSTISAQYRRTQLNDRTYETRYGLGQDLKRKAHRREEFMEALGLFLQQYSEETAREEEKLATRLGRSLTSDDRRTHKLRSSVSERDIEDIAELIDQYGSGLICSMLIAYGYARRSADTEA
jgi:hypothetical protein